MFDLKRELIMLLRKNSRANLYNFSRCKNISIKKVYYEFSKIKNKVNKFTTFLNFEKLGFVRSIIIFNNSIEGLTLTSKFMPFYVNNSFRLDEGLFVEYVFYSSNDRDMFLNKLKKMNVSFNHFPILYVLKQESFLS